MKTSHGPDRPRGAGAGEGGLRILQILEATLGGTARHVLDLCKGLRDGGHEVHLIYNPRPDRMDGLFRKGIPELAARGVILSPLDMSRKVGSPDLGVCLSVRAYIRSHGPFHVIHGHSSKAGAYARLGALGLPGKRVYTPHAFMTADPGLDRRGRLVYGTAERILGKCSDAVICVSEDEKGQARRLGIPDRKLRVVPNGADMSEDAMGVPLRREALGIPGEAVVVGYVGRMVPQKDPENLIAAFSLLAPRIPALRLAMVGSGPLEDAARSRAEGLGLADRIHWLGVRHGPAAMALFDVFALPSRYEGLPYVLIEAMAMGLPIVTTEIGGASTLIEAGGNGSMVPAGRPDLFAEALAPLVLDRELRERMSQRSKARARLFTVDHMVNGILGVYSGLAASK